MAYRSKINQRGLSLVELLVAVALLNVVLAVGYAFFFFGNNSFGIGTRQYNVQNNIRIAADVISDEVRYATHMEIFPNASYVPGTIGPFDSYIYVDSSTNQVVIASATETRTYPAGQTDSGITFSRSSANRILNYTVTGEDAQQTYTINREVNGLNIALSDSSVIDLSPDVVGGQGEVLLYRTLDNHLASTLEPEIESYTPSSNTLTITFNKNISSYTHSPSGMPLGASISGNSFIITTTGTLSNNTDYIINYELVFPGPFTFDFEVIVRRNGGSFNWSVERYN